MKNLNILFMSLLMAAPLSGMAQTDETETESESQPLVTHIRKAKKQEETRVITGRVVSYQGKTPLAGVLVQSVAGEGYSTLTEEDGTFTLNVPLYSSAVTVNIPGYNTVRVGLNKSGKLRDIVMQSSAAAALYGADDNINNDVVLTNWEFSSNVNIEDEISDKLNGIVRGNTRGGYPGEGSYLQLNGTNSFQSNAQPLIVLDGVPMDMQYSREYLHSGFSNDVLTNLNIKDIQSVKVMTNGTSLYGAKGGNGVIEIVTRRNTSMATKIEASAQVGVELVPETYSVMNGSQFKAYAAGLLQSTGTDAQSFRFLNGLYSRPGEPNPWYNKYNNNTNWGDEVYRNAVKQSYAFNVSGGGDVANYMLSVGYDRVNSTLKDNDLNRLNIRFNTDVKLGKLFTVRFDAAYTNQNRSLYDQGTPETYDDRSVTSLNFLASAKAPMLSPYSYVFANWHGNQPSGYFHDSHYDIEDEDYLSELTTLGNANWKLANPSAILKYGSAENKNYFDNGYLTLNVTPRVDINKNLFISTMFHYGLINTNEKYYVPINGVPSYYVNSLHTFVPNEIRALASTQNDIMSDTKIDWHDNFNGHNIHVLGGFRLTKNTFEYNTQLGYDTGNDKTPFIDNVAHKYLGGTSETRMSLNWYAQAEYNYANRYYLTGDLSMETNSQFGRKATSGAKMAGVVWGIFPSAQAAWIITNEKWFDVKGIDYMKLTAGFGVSGNDDIFYDARKTYLTSSLVNNTAAGLSIANVGNDKIQWETTKRFNAGLQVNALDNRIGVKFNYFHSWTDDLLTYKTLGFVSGMPYNWDNGGSMKNQGFDVTVDAHLVSGNNWNWTAGLTVGHYVNELTSLPDGRQYVDRQVLDGTVRSQIGRDISSFYGYVADGVFATTKEAVESNLYIEDETGKKTYFEAGDVKFRDLNGDGKIDDKDRTFIGCATPDIYGTFNTALSWKGLKLDVLFKYSLGGDVYNYARQQLESGSRFMNQTTAMLNRWTTEGQVTDMPRATYDDPMGNSRFSNRWIEDGSYLKLKTITLSYKLPINSTAIQGITVWGQACNLATLTKYLGTDPEFSCGNSVLYQGVDRGFLSQGRSFHIGVKINL